MFNFQDSILEDHMKCPLLDMSLFAPEGSVLFLLEHILFLSDNQTVDKNIVLPGGISN